MLYDEFIKGTGCRDNQHNYEVYKNLEVMYMNTDMTKEEIYEYGKKLVDNRKSEAVLRFEAKIKADIKAIDEDIKYYTERIDTYKWYLGFESDEVWIKDYKNSIKHYRDEIKKLKAQKRGLKCVLE